MLSIQNQLLQLLDRSLPFRVVIALMVGFLALFLVQEVESIHQGTACWGKVPFMTCLLYEGVNLVAVENVEGFSILVVAITYLIESRDRRKKKH
jgi:hypothetical protein